MREDGEAERSLMVLAVNFNTDDEKRTVMRTIGNDLYEKKLAPLAAVLASECWRSRSAAAGRYRRPEEDPFREEGIIVIGTTIGLKHHASQYLPIVRNAFNHIVPGQAKSLTRNKVESGQLKILFEEFTFRVVNALNCN